MLLIMIKMRELKEGGENNLGLTAEHDSPVAALHHSQVLLQKEGKFVVLCLLHWKFI